MTFVAERSERLTMADRTYPRVPVPARRQLRAFAFDPMSTRLTGKFLDVDVRFEQGLAPGPSGSHVHVIDYDVARDTWYDPVDLNDSFILAEQGLRPSESDPQSHQQIVYAVAMSVIERFERFGGRRFRWVGQRRLTLVPHAFEGRNAYFDPEHGAVLFGYYRASSKDPGANLPGQLMFTCLSVDIIAHEVTHAIVHRMRPEYQHATNREVFAWHEAFADLIALFHHFLFPDVVADAIAASEGELGKATALFDLALEFGEATGRGKALRSAIGSPRTPDIYLHATEPHELGACFVAAVFDAYLDTYRGAIAGLRRLATGGSGILPAGALPPDLVELATREAVKSADRILGMVVRAFEFLPVVDVDFGDVVKAIVTADRALYPDDELRLRATLVEALRRRGIRPQGVTSLAEEAITWQPPRTRLSLVEGPHPADISQLILDATRSLDISDRPRETPQRRARAGDPGAPEGVGTAPPRGTATSPSDEVASSLWKWADDHRVALGLDPETGFRIAGFHMAHLQAADGQVRPVVVVQLLQRREDLEEPPPEGEEPNRMMAGTTVIARVGGDVLYVVTKPLPAKHPEDLAAAAERIGVAPGVALDWNEAGTRRYEALVRWIDEIEDEDPLSPWTTKPAAQRLTFSQFHNAVAVLDTDDDEHPDDDARRRGVEALRRLLSDDGVREKVLSALEEERG